MDASCEDGARSLTAAGPGHFLIQVPLGGRKEVIEPTGGSPHPTRLLIDHDDTSTLAAPPAPGTDAQAADAAPSGKSMPISGGRHEFRDVPRDSRARLRVEFPKTTLPRSLSVHRRHLAVEFSNRKDTAYPVCIDPSVGLGVSKRTKLFSDGGKFWMSDGGKRAASAVRLTATPAAAATSTACTSSSPSPTL
jgi:hypothetical protein